MISRRITGRAAAMATITVLFAGAAAAAAGGVLPGPFSATSATEATATTGSGPTSSDPTTSGSDVTDPSSTGVAGTDGSGTTSPLPEAHGLCTAWNAGHAKKADNPAFSKLQHAADEMHATIDDYCTQVFANKGDHADETDSTDVESTDSTDVDQTPGTMEVHAGSQGSGHGHGRNG